MCISDYVDVGEHQYKKTGYFHYYEYNDDYCYTEEFNYICKKCNIKVSLKIKQDIYDIISISCDFISKNTDCYFEERYYRNFEKFSDEISCTSEVMKLACL